MSADVNWIDKMLEWGWTAVGAVVVWLTKQVHTHLKTQETHELRLAALEQSDKTHFDILVDMKETLKIGREETRQANESVRSDIRILTDTLLNKNR